MVTSTTTQTVAKPDMSAKLTVSSLIEQLQAFQLRHGDVEVFMYARGRHDSLEVSMPRRLLPVAARVLDIGGMKVYTLDDAAPGREIRGLLID